MVAKYINQDKENFTSEELFALVTGKSKPMWTCRQQTEDEMFTDIMNTRFNEEDWQTACQSVESDEDGVEVDFSEFSCFINKWENLYKPI